jgi:hypothetical protein
MQSFVALLACESADRSTFYMQCGPYSNPHTEARLKQIPIDIPTIIIPVMAKPNCKKRSKHL